LIVDRSELNDFQSALLNRFEELFERRNLTFDVKILPGPVEGGRATTWQATVEGHCPEVPLRLWIYDEGGDFHTNCTDQMIELASFGNLDDLSDKFLLEVELYSFEASPFYKKVVNLLTELTGYHPAGITPDTRVLEDLGIDGDDADDLFRELEKRFGVDTSEFPTLEYFGSEGFSIDDLFALPLLIVARLFMSARRYHAEINGMKSLAVADLCCAAETGKLTG
jgi:acyl carrier protein